MYVLSDQPDIWTKTIVCQCDPINRNRLYLNNLSLTRVQSVTCETGNSWEYLNCSYFQMSSSSISEDRRYPRFLLVSVPAHSLPLLGLPVLPVKKMNRTLTFIVRREWSFLSYFVVVNGLESNQIVRQKNMDTMKDFQTFIGQLKQN